MGSVVVADWSVRYLPPSTICTTRYLLRTVVHPHVINLHDPSPPLSRIKNSKSLLRDSPFSLRFMPLRAAFGFGRRRPSELPYRRRYMCSFAWRAYDNEEEERKNKRDLCLGVSRVFFHLSSTPTTTPTTTYYYRRISDLYGFDTAHPSRIGSRSSLADSDGENVIAAAFPQGPSPEKRNLRRLKYGSNCDVKPK